MDPHVVIYKYIMLSDYLCQFYSCLVSPKKKKKKKKL